MKNIISLLFLVMLSACSVVGPQERGIRLHSGNAVEVLSPGLHAWFPVLLGIGKVEVAIQKEDITASAASRDLQKVTTKVSVNWLINADSVLQVYKTLGDEDDAFKRVVMPAVNEVMKAAMSKLTAEEILSKRLVLKEDIDTQLKTRLARYGLILQDVSLVDLSFTTQFSHAIEEKQIAEQQAKQAHYVADKATQDAIASVNKARGQAQSNLLMARSQAESQKLLHSSLTDRILRMEYLKRWNGVLPSVLTGDNGNVMLNMAVKEGTPAPVTTSNSTESTEE